MDIITTLKATLTTSKADPVDLLSNAPQQITEDVVKSWMAVDFFEISMKVLCGDKGEH